MYVVMYSWPYSNRTEENYEQNITARKKKKPQNTDVHTFLLCVYSYVRVTCLHLYFGLCWIKNYFFLSSKCQYHEIIHVVGNMKLRMAHWYGISQTRTVRRTPHGPRTTKALPASGSGWRWDQFSVLLHNVTAHNVNVTGRVCYLS
jgi:hypothetical protein